MEAKSMEAAVDALAVLVQEEKEFELLPSELVELTPLNEKGLKDLHNEAERITNQTETAYSKMGRLMAELQAHQDKYRVLMAAKATIARRIEENSQLAMTLKVEKQLGETVPPNGMSAKIAMELQ